ncbi:unnamed protein product [Schistosoma intercalatum]|nr:unnamed protein product [Schistosoma intercalatum]
MKYFIYVIITMIIGVTLSYTVKDVDMSNIEESVNYQSNDNSSKPIFDQSKYFTLLLSLFYVYTIYYQMANIFKLNFSG